MTEKTRKGYSAQFKAELAVKILAGEATAAQLAAKHDISDRQLCRWRDEELARAVDVNAPAKLAEQKRQLRARQDKSEKLSKIVDFCSGQIAEMMPLAERKKLAQKAVSRGISKTAAARMMGLSGTVAKPK